MNIPIYKAEYDVPGLAEKIRANSSFVYSSLVEPSSAEEFSLSNNTKKALANKLGKASIMDKDLYRTKSILVTTNWNGNDDVFTKDEVWPARHTPSHKPTNIDHDEKQCVGHITDVWAMNEDGKILPDDTPVDDLPTIFHLVNGAVIYTNWEDKELISRTDKLIGEIESGKKFVSMECLFSSFGYALISPDGEFYSLARDKDTAFLTKHLRAFGGTGMYEGYKVGRLLQRIVFSGKGYVDNPANKESIILNNSSAQHFDYNNASNANPFSKRNGVFISGADTLITASKNPNTEKNDTMSETLEVYKERNSELKQDNDKLRAKVEELTQKSTEQGIANLETKISELESQLEAAKKEAEDAKAQVETLNKEKEQVETQLAETTKAKEKLDELIKEARAENTRANRVSMLIDGGISKDVAEKKVDVYSNLTDEQFKDIANELIEAAKAIHKDDDDDDDDDKKKKDKKMSKSSESDNSEETDDGGEVNAGTNLDDAEPNNDVDLNADANSDEENQKNLRKELVKAFKSRLGRNLNNDDENEPKSE